MARRTQTYQQMPWNGGVNTSVDPGVLNPNDLVQADNVQFDVSGSRLKREGIDYFDTELPAVTHRSSSGTTRTLVFAASINIASPVDQKIVVGEKLTVAGSGNANYNSTACIVSAISTTTIANDTIAYTFSGASSLNESSTAASATTVTRNYDILGVHDLWYYDSSNNVKTQQLVAITSQGKWFRYDSAGRRTELTKAAAATTMAADPTFCDMLTFNNRLLVTFSGRGNTPKVYNPNGGTTEWNDLGGTPPDGEFMQEHLGRVWMNDKDNRDRLHYSSTFNEAEWKGAGDSAAIDISIGDGDVEGIKAILPPYKGRLVVNKSGRSRMIVGEDPESFQVVPITDGLGSISHNAAAAVDMDDIFYTSRRGLHSLVATDTTGDFASNYLSTKIQPSFNGWNQSVLKNMQAVYVSNLNSIAFNVAESGDTKPVDLWFFNPTIQTADGQRGVWYRWPELNAQSLCTRLDAAGKVRLVMGNNQGRILIAQNGTYTDFADEAISYRVKSGTIYVDGNPQTIKGFKKLSLIFKPRGRFNFTVYFKVDNFPVQALVFEQDVQGDELGETFELGTSILGSNSVLAPFTKDIVGYGRGCSIEVFQSGVEAQVEIYGFIIEYEPADIADHVQQSATE